VVRGRPTSVRQRQSSGLFNSAASRAGGLLSNASDAALYKAHYDAFTQLKPPRRTGRRPRRRTRRPRARRSSSARTCRRKLQITQTDKDRYGINGGTRGNVADIANALIVSIKAFRWA